MNHGWLTNNTYTPTLPIPLNPDKTYIDSIENSKTPTTEVEKMNLQTDMVFKYHQVIGELIYPCFKACPEISPKSQYMDNPAHEQ